MPARAATPAIAEHHKTAMLEGGEWRATATSADPTTIGFHLSALYSPVGWLSWERIARAWEAAQGSDEAIRAFRNTILGETWVETGEAPDWRRLYDRRERWPAGTVPEGGLILTAGADVQKDRIEVDVWAWGRGLESWLVDHVVIDGGPESAAAWAALAALLGRTWPHALGAELQIARLAVDTGYEAPAVYAWARAQGFAQVAPVKGVEGFNRASPVSGPTYVDATVAGKRLRRGARLWTVAVSTFKAETYRFLRLERPTGRGDRRRRADAARDDPPAGLGGERVAEAVRRRAAGHGKDQARLRPARMAEAAGAQRGARCPGLRPRRRLDRRPRPLVGGALGRGRARGERRARAGRRDRRSAQPEPPARPTAGSAADAAGSSRGRWKVLPPCSQRRWRSHGLRANEALDGSHVVFRVGDMRDVTRGREDVELSGTQGSGDLIHDRSKHRWAQRSLGQQRRLREAGKAAEVDGKLIRVVGFIEERWSIHDHDLLSFRGKLCPGARAERHGLYELLGGARVIARDDPVHNRGDPIAHRPEQGSISRLPASNESSGGSCAMIPRRKSGRSAASRNVIEAPNEFPATHAGPSPRCSMSAARSATSS